MMPKSAARKALRRMLVDRAKEEEVGLLEGKNCNSSSRLAMGLIPAHLDIKWLIFTSLLARMNRNRQ
jgi:hypothetical protein